MTFQKATLALIATSSIAWQGPVAASNAIMDAVGVDATQFAIVSAPIIGSGRSQLQIYEQLGSQRSCFTFNGNTVEPLLATFDFTDICQRYIDSNGYSLRIGKRDLATVYSLSVRRTDREHVLVAVPSRAEAGPELEIARTTESGGDQFLRFRLNEGWSLRRRSWQGVRLGHLYLYREDWPTGSQGSTTASDNSTPSEAPVNTFTSVTTTNINSNGNSAQDSVKEPAQPTPLF